MTFADRLFLGVFSLLFSAMVVALTLGAVSLLSDPGPDPGPETVAVDVWTEHGDLMRCYVLGEVPLFCERIDQPDD